jgi:hypothetical protein
MSLERFRASALALGLAGMLGVLTVLPALAATLVVTPSNMQGWVFVKESPSPVGPGSGTLVSGPGTPPLGSGSARLTVSAASEGQAVVKTAFQGTRLATLTRLEYSTYRTTGGLVEAIALQFAIDSDVTDSDNGFQGRLVFEPYQGAPAGTVVPGVWQTWNPLVQGKWWGTPGSGLRPITAACPQSAPCTMQQILTQFPNAGIHNTQAASLVLKAGSGWNSFDGNVDALTVGVLGADTTFDFETVPQNKDDCKNGGWQNLTRSNGTLFKNQGDCVSYTSNGG